MDIKKINIDNKGLSLEACLELPGEQGPHPGVVLCHPHPLYGGDMHNNVIVSIGNALVAEGIAGLRFNFRGVGRSQGSFDNGIGEREDAGEALSFLSRQEEVDKERIGILGYSFGGMVALSAGARSSIAKVLAAVSPVVPSGVPADCSKPKFIVSGENDNMIPYSTILQETEKMSEPKIVEIISGVDHFWWGYENRLAGMVVDFFKRYLF